MKDELLYAGDPDLIRRYIKEGHKVMSIGYFSESENPIYNFTFKKKPQNQQ